MIKKLPRDERITDTAKRLVDQANNLLADAEMIDDPDKRAKVVTAAMLVVRTALNVDKAEVDKKTAADADKIATMRSKAARLAELDA